MRQALKLAKISLIIVLFGQFGLSAITYYLQIAHPSWPFWITLYAISGVLAFRYIPQHKSTIQDLYFCTFIGYVITSFVILGESSEPEFIQRIILICIAPYLSGRMFGQYAPPSLFGNLQVLSTLYVLLIGVELAHNPSLLQVDRLYFFATDLDSGGGTGFNIGTTLGAAWASAFAYYTYKGEQHGVPVVFRTRFWLLAVVVSFPVVLMLVGSRSSIVSIVLSALILLGFAFRIFTRMKVSWLVVMIAGLLVSYNYLSEERKLLIDDMSVAAERGSVFERLVQLSDAWQLFLEFPLFGIGSTNYGLRYSGHSAEFGSPHSLFAQVLVEDGLIGAGLLALMLVMIVRTFSRQMRSQDYHARPVAWGLFGMWIFVLIQAQFIGNLYYDYHVFLLTGLFISCLYNGERWVTKSNRSQEHTTTKYCER